MRKSIWQTAATLMKPLNTYDTIWSDERNQRAGAACLEKHVYIYSKTFNNVLNLYPCETTHINTLRLTPCAPGLPGVYSFSTWSHKTKVVHSGNGATRNTICSGGRPLCCHLHAWTAVNDRHTAWRLSQSTNPRPPNCQRLLAAVLITLYSMNCLSALFMNTACVPRVQLLESIWMYWTPTYESNHKVYIQEQGCYGHLSGAVKITLVICSPGSKQSGNIWGQ